MESASTAPEPGIKKETQGLPTPKRVAVSVHHLVNSFHCAGLIMLDSSVRSGVFSTCPMVDLCLVGNAVRRGLVFWQIVNGMPQFPNSVKRLTYSGDRRHG